MRITWASAKRETTQAMRGLDFADTALVFDDATATLADIRFAYPSRASSRLAIFGAA